MSLFYDKLKEIEKKEIEAMESIDGKSKVPVEDSVTKLFELDQDLKRIATSNERIKLHIEEIATANTLIRSHRNLFSRYVKGETIGAGSEEIE